MKRSLILSIACGCLIALPAFSQAPVAVLSKGDVQKFIESYHPMTNELEDLGHDFDQEGDPNPQDVYGSMQRAVTAMMAYEGVTDILKKYGWEEDFASKYMAIGMGYSYHMMIKALDDVPEDQQEMAKPMIDMMTQQITMMVHEDDIEMVKPYLADLEKVFEEKEN